jgi:hypothetical protein
MTVFAKSAVEFFYNTGRPSRNVTGAVRLESDEVTVEYPGEHGQERYFGKALAPGHYELRCIEIGGRATLHRFPGSDYLEGYWSQDHHYGMWRVQLINED